MSTDAIRKRLQRGTIPGEKIGETWRVFLEADTTTGWRPDMSSRQPDTDRTTAAAVDPLVETLREEVVYLREQLAGRSRELAAERERSDVLMREALARLPALASVPARMPPAHQHQFTTRWRPRTGRPCYLSAVQAVLGALGVKAEEMPCP